MITFSNKSDYAASIGFLTLSKIRLNFTSDNVYENFSALMAEESKNLQKTNHGSI